MDKSTETLLLKEIRFFESCAKQFDMVKFYLQNDVGGQEVHPNDIKMAVNEIPNIVNGLRGVLYDILTTQKELKGQLPKLLEEGK
jgi:hypothetical protein